jgi:hypothetical protein
VVEDGGRLGSCTSHEQAPSTPILLTNRSFVSPTFFAGAQVLRKRVSRDKALLRLLNGHLLPEQESYSSSSVGRGRSGAFVCSIVKSITAMTTARTPMMETKISFRFHGRRVELFFSAIAH